MRHLPSSGSPPGMSRTLSSLGRSSSRSLGHLDGPGLAGRRHGSNRLPAGRLTSAPIDDLRKILPRDRLPLEESGDDGVERGPVVAEQHTSPVLGFSEQTAHLLVNDLLGAFGIGPFLAKDGP